MSDPQIMLSSFSDALAARVEQSLPLVVSVRVGEQRGVSGIAWRGDLVVTSEQALPKAEAYTVNQAPAALVGRDPGSNVALLRRGGEAVQAAAPPGGAARIGAIALALGARIQAEPTAQWALIRAVGPAWRSLAGGRIDQLIRLDMRAGRDEEGGPVIDAGGGLLGMATAGPRGRSLVIPAATIERAVGQILTHGSVRGGWLGVGLQPVAIPPALRQAAGQESGLMVVSLAPDAPAEQAGMLPGDILLALDGTPLLHPRGIRAHLGPERVGQPAEVRILRAGEVQSVTITVAARPAR